MQSRKIPAVTYSVPMAAKFHLFISYGTVFIASALVLRIISFSSPVTDEYCFATSVDNYGIWNAFLAWNRVWSPSLGYLPTLSLWSLDLDPLIISRLMSMTGLLVILVLGITFIRVSTENTKVKKIILGALMYFCALVFTFSLIPSFTYQYMSPNPLKIVANLKLLFEESILNLTDGELLLWVFGISISWQKVIFGALLSIVILLSQLVFLKKLSPYYISSLGLLFVLYGPNTETLIFLIYLIFFTIYLLVKQRTPIKLFTIINLLLIFVFVLSTKTVGSSYRKSKFANLNFSDQLIRIISLGCKLTVMLAITLIVSYFLIRNLRSNNFEFNFNLKIELLIGMLIAAIIGNFIVATTVYVSTYHWVSFVSVSFTLSSLFWIIRSKQTSIAKNILHSPLRVLIALLLVTLAFSTLLETSMISESRSKSFNIRKEINSTSQNKLLLQLPVKDINGRTFVFDLSPGVFGISPMYGWSVNSQIRCYRESNSNW
jgi:hypothetical protein